jgi:hypothetical protein
MSYKVVLPRFLENSPSSLALLPAGEGKRCSFQDFLYNWDRSFSQWEKGINPSPGLSLLSRRGQGEGCSFYQLLLSKP